MRNRGISERAKAFRRRSPRKAGERAAKGRKRATNVSIDVDILEQAKRMDINLSQTLEEALRRRVEDARIETWQKENKALFEFINDYVERNGTMSEALLDLDDPAV